MHGNGHQARRAALRRRPRSARLSNARSSEPATSRGSGAGALPCGKLAAQPSLVACGAVIETKRVGWVGRLAALGPRAPRMRASDGYPGGHDHP